MSRLESLDEVLTCRISMLELLLSRAVMSIGTPDSDAGSLILDFLTSSLSQEPRQ